MTGVELCFKITLTSKVFPSEQPVTRLETERDMSGRLGEDCDEFVGLDESCGLVIGS